MIEGPANAAHNAVINVSPLHRAQQNEGRCRGVMKINTVLYTCSLLSIGLWGACNTSNCPDPISTTAKVMTGIFLSICIVKECCKWEAHYILGDE